MVPRAVPDHLPTFVQALAQRGRRLGLYQAAASLSFLSLLALVPLFTIAVSLLGALPVLEQPRASLLNFLASNFFLPSFSATLVRYLNQFAAQVNQLSLIGASVFLATAFSALLTIDRTLNRIWATDRPRPLVRRLTIYWTFLTLGPLLLAATLTLNGLIVSELLGGTQLRALERFWLPVLPLLLTAIGLTLLYRILPNAPVRWSDALAGGIGAALALALLQRGMAIQVARLPTYTIVYGAFAALPLFLIWLFAAWLMVLAGAVFAATLPQWGRTAPTMDRTAPAARFEAAVAVLSALNEAAGHGRVTISPADMPDVFAQDGAFAEETACLLCDLGYLERYWRLTQNPDVEAERGIWDEHWSLRAGAAGMRLRPLFEALWAPGLASVSGKPLFDPDSIDRTLADMFSVAGQVRPTASPR